MMKANQKPFYVRDYDETEDGVAIYSDPRRVYLNLFPTNADSDLIALGADYREYMRASIPSQQAKQFGIGDLVYVDKPMYDSPTDIGNALYRVTEILTVITVSELLCRRLSGEG